MNKHGTYHWPVHVSGKPKSLGEMTNHERVAAEGFVHQERAKMTLMAVIVKAFLERQTMIALENLALGKDIG